MSYKIFLQLTPQIQVSVIFTISVCAFLVKDK
jgi:hypothetical protein